MTSDFFASACETKDKELESLRIKLKASAQSLGTLRERCHQLDRLTSTLRADATANSAALAESEGAVAALREMLSNCEDDLASSKLKLSTTIVEAAKNEAVIASRASADAEDALQRQLSEKVSGEWYRGTSFLYEEFLSPACICFTQTRRAFRMTL